MTIERLWAGWRSQYVSEVAHVAPGECVFCALLTADGPERDSLVVWRGQQCAAVLNLYPYASGHLLFLPLRHVADLEALTAEEGAELWQATTAGVVALKAAYSPDGVNVGANLGRSAGAGVPGHLHLHAVPRWTGDTNFMTSVAEIRVMPEDLGTSFDKIRAAWPAEARP